MFPTDRWAWSSKDGRHNQPKQSFVLPENWEWEDDWHLNETVPGDEKVHSINYLLEKQQL